MAMFEGLWGDSSPYQVVTPYSTANSLYSLYHFSLILQYAGLDTSQWYRRIYDAERDNELVFKYTMTGDYIYDYFSELVTEVGFGYAGRVTA